MYVYLYCYQNGYMEQAILKLEAQIKAMEAVFRNVPEFIQVNNNGIIKTKYNSRYFALKNKLKQKYKRLEDLKRLKYLAM